MPRNPNWTRDELILALDLYFKVNPAHIGHNHPDVVELSNLLNALPIHPTTGQNENFRNPSGVYMKMCNFLRLDPDYQGEGLNAGSKLDVEVWDEFFSNKQLLSEVASAIRANYQELSSPRSESQDNEIIDEDEEFPEGRVLTRIHKLRERNSKAVKQKKQQVLNQTGKLACEVCGFDFFENYGEIGQGFAECHHISPISTLKTRNTIKTSDLAIICSNCHRMMHRVRPWITVSELRKRLEV